MRQNEQHLYEGSRWVLYHGTSTARLPLASSSFPTTIAGRRDIGNGGNGCARSRHSGMREVARGSYRWQMDARSGVDWTLMWAWFLTQPEPRARPQMPQKSKT